MTTENTESIFSDINEKLSNSNENNQDKKLQNEEGNILANESIKEENKLLGKKTRRNGKKENNEYCAACEKNGGNLLFCDECIRAYHIECLKLNEKDILKDKWLCPICSLKKR